MCVLERDGGDKREGDGRSGEDKRMQVCCCRKYEQLLCRPPKQWLKHFHQTLHGEYEENTEKSISVTFITDECHVQLHQNFIHFLVATSMKP